MELLDAIIADDLATVSGLLAASPERAQLRAHIGANRQAATEQYITAIEHYLYAGDSALHIAAAAHRPAMARLLVGTGADVGARNRRDAQPLHYAADGSPGSPTWMPVAQAATIKCLLDAGADPNATDRGGVTPLHRAVRTRCAAAAAALIEGGADPQRPTRRGSTPWHLASCPSGRGGSGSPESRDQQNQILDLLERLGGGQLPRNNAPPRPSNSGPG